MAQYTQTVQATSNTTADTEDTFIEWTAGSGVSILIKRIRVSISTAASDTRARIRVVRKSAAGTGGVAGSAVKRHPTDRAASITPQIKSGTTAFTTGTVTDVLIDVCINARGVFEWTARDDDDMIETAAAGSIGILIRESAASIICNVEADWVE